MSGDYPNNYRYPGRKFITTKCCCCGKESKTYELINHYCNAYCPGCYQEQIIDHGKKDLEKIKNHCLVRKEYNPHIGR